MAQETGHGEVSVQGAHTPVAQLLVFLRRIGMTKAMEGKWPVRILIPDISPVFQDEELQGVEA